MFTVSVMTIAFMTLALCAMALGFGTLFPQFETENAAQIPTSFGGLVFMIASVGLIAAVITLEARPVYSYLSSQFYGTPTSTSEMVFGFGAAMLLCVLATVIPIAIAKRRLEAVER
jgi:ABC-2 type transport system permease protein